MSNARRATARQMPGREEIIRRAGLLDQRRQRQIANQADSIGRLLGDRDAAAEIGRLHERIADLEGQLALAVPAP